MRNRIPKNTMLCPLYQAATTHPNATAYLGNAPVKTYTFLDWHRAAEGVAHHIRTHYPPKTRIAIHQRAQIETCAWIWGAARQNCTLVLIPDRIHTGQISKLCTQVGATLYTGTQPKPQSGTEISFDACQPCVILFSSGSTQAPKAIVHSISSLLASAKASQKNITLRPGHTWLLSLSMAHIGGLAISFRTLIARATMVAGDSDIGVSIARHNISHVSLVAAQLQKLLHDQNDLSSLEAVLVGGGPIPSALIARASHLPLHTTYGMTELGSQLCTTPPQPHPSDWQTAGYPLPTWQLKLDDRGQIMAKGPALFLGYLRDHHVVSARDHEGWFATKDRGKLDFKGRLVVLGRMDQMFISGGENIHPEEIEEVLMQHESIEVAIIVPLPHDRWGMRPVAIIKGNYTIDQLLTWLQSKLPRFKIPDAFLPWPEHLSTHKPQRADLKAYAQKNSHAYTPRTRS